MWSVSIILFAAKEVADRMTTLRNMLGAVRRKENKAKSGSAPYHPTHRDRVIKAKLGFLERHIKTRTSVSTLPNVGSIPPIDKKTYLLSGQTYNRCILKS